MQPSGANESVLLPEERERFGCDELGLCHGDHMTRIHGSDRSRANVLVNRCSMRIQQTPADRAIKTGVLLS